MSLHLRLRPARVGSESKNKRSGPDDWGSDLSVMGLCFISACPVCVVTVVSASRGTWSKLDPDGPGAVIGMDSKSALVIGATRIQIFIDQQGSIS